MAEQDLLVRLKLENDLSRPMDEVRSKVRGTADEITRAGRSSTGAATELTRMERAAGVAGSAVGTLGTHLLVANRNTSLLGGTLRQLGGLYLGREIVQFGVNAVESAQRGQAAFTTYLQSGDKAKQLYTDLGKLKTPFALSSLTEGTQQLLQMGVTSDQILPSVQGIADAVSAVGGSSGDFSKVAGALGDIHQSAKLSADQLKRVGMNSAEVLGKSRGMTGAQVLAGLDNGTLRITGAQAYDALISGFEAQASGSAAKASTTLAGTLAGLGNTTAEAINKAVGPEQLKDLTTAVGGLAQILPPLAVAATPFLHVLGDTLGFLGAHPHLTEGLAGLLVFREVAGFALQTSGAVKDIASALSVGNTEGALRMLLGAGGSGGGNGPGGGGGSGDGSSAQDTLSSIHDNRAGSHGQTFLAAGTKGLALASAAYATYQGIGSGQRALQDRYGHGNDGRGWHWQDAGKGAAVTAQDSATGFLAGEAAAQFLTARTGLPGWASTPLGAVAGLPLGAVGAVGGAFAGIGKSSWDYFHDKQGYSLSASGKTARDAAQGAGVTAPVQVNVTTGTSAADIQTAMLTQLQSPEFRAQMQAAIDESARQDRLRGRGN